MAMLTEIKNKGADNISFQILKRFLKMGAQAAAVFYGLFLILFMNHQKENTADFSGTQFIWQTEAEIKQEIQQLYTIILSDGLIKKSLSVISENI